MEIVTGAHSDTGKVRTRNEDAFVCMSGRPDLVNVDAIFGVADGMGGHAAGDVASRIAVDHITAQMIDPNKDIFVEQEKNNEAKITNNNNLKLII